MRNAKKYMGFLLAAVLLAGLLTGCCCCPNLTEELAKQTEEPEENSEFFGTWVSTVNSKVNSELEQIADYKIFDANGYWDVYITYQGLRNGMEAQPKSFTTFEHFIDGNIFPGISGCTFEYVENTAEYHYTDTFMVNEDGTLARKNSNNLFYTKFSPYAGYPETAVLEECKEIFDRAAADAEAARLEQAEEIIVSIFDSEPATAGSDLTINDAIGKIFHEYTWSFDACEGSDTLFEVTVSGKYKPYPVDRPTLSWSGEIRWQVDIESGTAHVVYDPDQIGNLFGALVPVEINGDPDQIPDNYYDNY